MKPSDPIPRHLNENYLAFFKAAVPLLESVMLELCPKGCDPDNPEYVYVKEKALEFLKEKLASDEQLSYHHLVISLATIAKTLQTVALTICTKGLVSEKESP